MSINESRKWSTYVDTENGILMIYHKQNKPISVCYDLNKEGEMVITIAEKDIIELKETASIFDEDIQDFSFRLDSGVSYRVYNCLKKEDILCVGKLCSISKRYIEGLPDMGKKSLQEIEKALKEMGLTLGMDEAKKYIRKNKTSSCSQE